MNSINKKELTNKYKQQEIEMGIIQAYNTVTGYSFVDICSNLYSPFESIKFQLILGKSKSKKLQADFDVYGENSFEFKIVEKLKPNESATEKGKVDELKELLDMWVESQGENLKLYKK